MIKTFLKMDNLSIEILGLIAGCIGLFSWIPQLRTTWKYKLHEGIDLRTLSIMFTALSMWCVYGVLKQAWAVSLSNLFSGLIILLIIYKVKKLRSFYPPTPND